VPKQKYRLQPVLDVRDKAKQAAAVLVATRREQLVAAEEKLRQRREELAACRRRQAMAQEQMFKEFERAVEAHTLVTHRTHLADLRRIEEEMLAKVEEQRRAVVNAEAEVEKALTALIEASREVQVIEKHRENWRQRARRDEQLRDQKIGDEIGAITYRRGRGQS
jgi:flagellar export protein FliJ